MAPKEDFLLKLQCAGATISNMRDRFVGEGYKPEQPVYDLEQKLELYSKIGGMRAVPVGYPGTGMDPIKFAEMCKNHGLQVGTVDVSNYWQAKWKYGTISARNPERRREIVQYGKEAMDWCAAAGGIDTMYWLAHDGYNYPFQDNYAERWDCMKECLYEIASHRPDVKVTLEYKTYEPLTHQYANNTARVILMCEEIGLDNMGVIVDYGHALFGGENPAESVALAHKYNRLSMIHLNDNYGKFDDDLIFGTVSFWQALEFFWKLDEIGYDGWFIMDNWPARMDGVEATTEFVQMANHLMRLAKSLPKDEIHRLQAQDGNPPKIYNLLREYVLK